MLRAAFLMFFLSTGAAFAANELTLHVYSSYHGLEWSSPRALLKSFVRNSAAQDPHSISHINVELRCDALPPLDGTWPTLTGTTTADGEDPQYLITKKGYGFTALFAEVIGRFYTAKEILPELTARQEKGNLSFLKFRLSEPTCARLVDYLKEYRAKNYVVRYGLPNRPRHREGAGCSAFGMSFLDIAGGLPASLHPEWLRTVEVGEDLMGGPGTNRWISPTDILLKGRFSKWIEGNVAVKRVTFWDPEKIDAWIAKYWDAKVSYPDFPSEKATIGKAKGVLVDLSRAAAPKDAIFFSGAASAK